MTQTVQPIVLNAQAIASMSTESFPETIPGGNAKWKTLLSSSRTPSNTFTSGIATCRPSDGHLKCHRHTHPEVYHVTQGRGIVSIDGKDYSVEKGTVVFIPGDSEHGIRNVDEKEDLIWLYVFATDKFEDVVYRFSEPEAKAKL